MITPAGAGRAAPRGAATEQSVFATGETATGLAEGVLGRRPTDRADRTRPRARGRRPLRPEFLPGGEAVLFTIIPATGGIESAVAVLTCGPACRRSSSGGSHAHYVQTGHLVYGVMGTLRCSVRPRRLEVVGTALPVLEGVVTTAVGAADIAVAANGSLSTSR